METNRDAFRKHISKLYEKASKLLNSPHNPKPTENKKVTQAILGELEELKTLFRIVQKKQELHNLLEQEKSKYETIRKRYKIKVKTLIKAKKDINSLKKMNEESDMLDYNQNLKVSGSEILLYASKISNFIQAPPGYKT